MSQSALVGSINSAELARCLFEESNDALVVVDPQSLRLLDVNPLLQRISKRTRKDLLDLTLTDLFVSDDSLIFGELLRSCQETTIYHSRESHQLIRADGECLAVNVTVSRLHTTPTPLALVSVRDISKRKMLEDELRRTQQQLQQALAEKTNRLVATSDELQQSTQRMKEILDDIDAIVWEANLPCMEFTFVSKQAEALLGFPVQRWLSEADFLANHIHPEDVDECRQRCEEAVGAGRDHEVQFRMIRRDGATVWIQGMIHVVSSETGEPVKLRGVLVDISERIEAEQRKTHLALELRKKERQLAHVARLSTLGEMVAGISHEINQPLSAIANFANAALQTLDRAEVEFDVPLKEWMRQISEQAVRCGDIIRRLRGYSRRNGVAESTVNVRQATENATSILRDLMQEHAIKIEFDIDADYWVQISDVEFQQVLVNLARNACEAVIEGDSRQPRIHISARQSDDFVHILMEDNGPGIPEEFRESVFDAFFTSREDGMGMGLGISRSIIQRHGGTLSLDEGYHDGTRFAIRIPLMASREEPN